MKQNYSSNKRIAKNTLVLYIRTAIVLCVSLFTSRVILHSLGVEDYGIYNVVGGIVSFFTIITSALSQSVSRFITISLGKGDPKELNKIFINSVNIQLIFGIMIIILAELFGCWFINRHLNIPPSRLYAANWVYQFSVVSFVINLLSVPYNALIIAHEKMEAFAYISLIDVLCKLGIAYAIYITPLDKLVTYSFLLLLVAVFIRIIYGYYCIKRFEECNYRFIWDKEYIKEMISFAGWNLLSNSTWVINTTGINFLINIYFGILANAARGIATQVESAIKKFIGDFTVAMNPQIIKNYAAGDYRQMHTLVCRSAKFSFVLTLLFSLPLIFETEYILQCWLGNVPPHTADFLRLTLVSTSIDFLGNSLYIGCQASGKLKTYTIVTSSIPLCLFPITWVLYWYGFPVESCYYVFIGLYGLVFITKVVLSQRLFGLPCKLFVFEVVFRIIPITIFSVIFPCILKHIFDKGIIEFLSVSLSSIVSVLFFTFVLGLSDNERSFIIEKIKKRIRQYTNH